MGWVALNPQTWLLAQRDNLANADAVASTCGAPTQPKLESLSAGTYYVAICSWDEDRNLSRLSNVVKVQLGK